MLCIPFIFLLETRHKTARSTGFQSKSSE